MKGGTIPICFYMILTSSIGSLMATNKSLYFGYGSNLLERRMHRSNPNAVRYGKGVLKDYTLDMGTYGHFWKGCGANIVQSPGDKVWGALWQLKDEDFVNLDRQESVHKNVYKRIIVQIETPEGQKLNAIAYQNVKQFERFDLTNLPTERRPSPAYMDVIIKGAQETGLPIDYINFLKTISTNGIDHVPNLDPEK
ncbi:gamma-glutamylcyclotransferase isoform X1 [Diabrotica virgifera virgifera]|uniref:gamma-glutamylcyclotransferase n=2 Tax=Diabrotica virgifera virgifera TaxID=50390 RepID=A0ABM5ISP0_DIAVI|nr:gamma-glutamylcyclotransferase isoform X1 [Diabrotica virgifera virgifera]